MSWYIVMIIGLAMLAAGYAWAYCIYRNKISSETSGRLFITKSNNQPFLAASVPIETIAKHKYVMFEVKVVDDSQK